MAKRTILTAARLRDTLHYNPKTGKFRWLERKKGRRPNKIGTVDNRLGYRKIGIDGYQYFEHRLAWLYMTGKWPRFEIDHKNRKPSDNRWKNLRDITHAANENNKGILKTNTSGVSHVSRNNRDKLWVVHFSFAKKADAVRVAKMVKLIVKLHHKGSE